MISFGESPALSEEAPLETLEEAAAPLEAPEPLEALEELAPEHPVKAIPTLRAAARSFAVSLFMFITILFMDLGIAARRAIALCRISPAHSN